MRKIIEKEDRKNVQAQVKQVRNLEYPDSVLTAAALGGLVLKGENLRFKEEDCLFIRNLDNLKGTIFGGGFLLSERAAAERAAAERAAAEKIQLSKREIKLQKKLGKQLN